MMSISEAFSSSESVRVDGNSLTYAKCSLHDPTCVSSPF